MALVVQKFGGTSVGDVEKIKNVARRVARRYDTGDQMVVVLSAMAGVTDSLIDLARQASDDPDNREMDVLLSTGEQTTVALMAMTLNDMGYKAMSMLGFQAEILTDAAATRARIISIGTEKIHGLLNDGCIIIVAGFQGCDAVGNITTLGRGGSDTSAVALASALAADVCEIYTDVDGVYTADPSVCKKARKLDAISYDEMMEMSSLGAKVLQIRSMEFAKKYNVPVHVRSSFSEEEGTMVVSEETVGMEELVISGVTCTKDAARITFRKVPDKPGVSSSIFTPLAEAGILVDMIIQNTRASGQTDLTFTVPRNDFKKALEISEKTAKTIEASDIVSADNIAKVSVIGVGMKNHSGVASRMFSTLAAENINILMISTSEIRISCVIEEKYAELAVQELHTAFGLDKEE